MKNFNEGKLLPSNYSGAEAKFKVLFDNVIYMVKIPKQNETRKTEISYVNSQFSEHIGSNIFRICGFNAQETELDFYTNNKGTTKTVVACKDFTQDGSKLYEFLNLSKFQMNSHELRDCNIEDVYELINENVLLENKEEIIEKFWDMFVIDALLGNRERHLGNWGLLEKEGKLQFAPIYDCGSTLNPLINEHNVQDFISDVDKMKNIEYNVTSKYKLNGKKIFYHEIFKNPTEDLSKAITRTVPKINIEKISSFINLVDLLSAKNKEYLISSIKLRYDLILFPALTRIMKKEKEANQGKNLTGDLKKYKQVADKHNSEIEKKYIEQK